jgi:hypothetical protein
MTNIHKNLVAVAVTVLLAQTAAANQFVVELDTPLADPSVDLMSSLDIILDETLSAGEDSYAVFEAEDQQALETFLASATIDAAKISEVLFVNSPTVGGGKQASPELRPGHQVYVIERPIPGVGFLGLEKKQNISRNSNAAIEKLGDIIEWDHSYLTSEGTYCVYRADSPETLREHGALAGAPIGKITPVEQVVH